MKRRIVEIARTWIGTPWKHNQSAKGLGTDCVGLLLGIGKELGMFPERIPNYARIPQGDSLLRELEKYLLFCSEYEDGDVLVFRRMGVITHVGIVSDKKNKQIIHATNHQKIGVVEVYYDIYESNIVGSYEYDGRKIRE